MRRELDRRHGLGCGRTSTSAATVTDYVLSGSITKRPQTWATLVSQISSCQESRHPMSNDYMKLTCSPRTDAMNEVAWCYLEGFGCKKDKVSIHP